MVKRLLVRANQKASFGVAASLLAGSSFIALLLGLLRELFLAGGFGATSPEVAAYKVAFTVPDFMFFVLTSGALAVTFIPVFNERYSKGNKKSAWELSSSFINSFAVLTFIASVLIIIFADVLVKYVVAPGLYKQDPEAAFLAISMMRIVAINPLLFSVSTVFTSMQQAVGRFFFVSLAPIFYNLSIIFGIVVLAPENGFNMGIMGVAIGVVLGSITQLIVSFGGLAGLGFDYKPRIFWKNKGFRQVLRILPARSLDQGMDYFQNIVDINLASRISVASIGAYSYAYILHTVPITLIGVALSTAAYPRLTERLAHHRPDLFKQDVVKLLRLVIWLALPATAVTFLLRGYLVRIIVRDGNAEIAALLGVFAWVIIFRSLYHVLSRSFYAQQDTRTPLYVSVGTVSLTILLAIWWSQPQNFGLIGLPLSQLAASIIESSILIFILQKRFPNLIDRPFLGAFWRMLSAFAITFWVTWVLRREFLELGALDKGFFTLITKMGLLCMITALVYIGLSWLFKLEEVNPIIAKTRAILFKPIKLQ
ncbi:murein biosynthesis integral membrane protein MurJ [Candidatus Saccharibacteria bacterium]|nr:murein biosynthesis integral membrane protein MurJ [Candidatus Saccharibacteria bacterium]